MLIVFGTGCPRTADLACGHRIRPPDIAYAIAEPTRGDDFLPHVKLHAFATLDVQVAVKGIVPAGEGEQGHWRGDTDVDADHAGFDAMLEFARGFAGLSEDGGAVAIA